MEENIEQPSMEIKTEAGLTKPMPLSDLQRYNTVTKIFKVAIALIAILGVWLLGLVTYIIYKILSTGAVNTYIAHCV